MAPFLSFKLKDVRDTKEIFSLLEIYWHSASDDSHPSAVLHSTRGIGSAPNTQIISAISFSSSGSMFIFLMSAVCSANQGLHSLAPILGKATSRAARKGWPS